MNLTNYTSNQEEQEVKLPEPDEFSNLAIKERLKAILLKRKSLERKMIKVDSKIIDIQYKIRALEREERKLKKESGDLGTSATDLLWKLDRFIPSLIKETKDELKQKGLL